MPDTHAIAAAGTDLFEPVRLGPYTLANRVVMAPLTRSRAKVNDAPGKLQAE
jgi:N-ethylmaleimide reductase